MALGEHQRDAARRSNGRPLPGAQPIGRDIGVRAPRPRRRAIAPLARCRAAGSPPKPAILDQVDPIAPAERSATGPSQTRRLERQARDQDDVRARRLRPSPRSGSAPGWPARGPERRRSSEGGEPATAQKDISSMAGLLSVAQSFEKIVFDRQPEQAAMRKASGRLGSYLPVSIALTLWRETSSRSARSPWLQSRSARSTLRRFFTRRHAARVSQLRAAEAEADEPEDRRRRRRRHVRHELEILEEAPDRGDGEREAGRDQRPGGRAACADIRPSPRPDQPDRPPRRRRPPAEPAATASRPGERPGRRQRVSTNRQSAPTSSDDIGQPSPTEPQNIARAAGGASGHVKVPYHNSKGRFTGSRTKPVKRPFTTLAPPFLNRPSAHLWRTSSTQERAPMSEMLSIKLPDGSVREVERGTTPADVAAAIGPGLAKAALAARVNGEVRDIGRPFEGDAELALITSRDEADALELARHDYRPRPRRGGAEPVSGHADHLRPGDRRRLLLRFRAAARARPLHRGGSARDRGGDAPHHRAPTSRWCARSGRARS